MSPLTIRYAQESDIPQILFFIKKLAICEKMLDDVVATKNLLREWIFEKKKAEVIFAEENDKPVDFALFAHRKEHMEPVENRCPKSSFNPS